MSETFNAVVGAKRQLTIPAGLFRQMSLKEGDQIRLTVEGDAVLLEPMVSVPRHMVSESLLQEMQSRRGVKPTDLTLEEFRARRQQQEQANEQAFPSATAEPAVKGLEDQVRKVRVSRDQVTVRKHVIGETDSVSLPVTREELVIERHAPIEKSTVAREDAAVGGCPATK